MGLHQTMRRLPSDGGKPLNGGEMGINRGRVISKFNKSKILDNRVTIIRNYGEMKQNLEELEKASKRNFLTPCPEVKAVSFS